jgi:hypothetical protein
MSFDFGDRAWVACTYLNAQPNSIFFLSLVSVIDITTLTKKNPSYVLTLDVALQWLPLKHDPKEPTLLLFKFGWVEDPYMKKTCVCKIPGNNFWEFDNFQVILCPLATSIYPLWIYPTIMHNYLPISSLLELDGPAVSVLGVRSRKLGNVSRSSDV